MAQLALSLLSSISCWCFWHKISCWCCTPILTNLFLWECTEGPREELQPFLIPKRYNRTRPFSEGSNRGLCTLLGLAIILQASTNTNTCISLGMNHDIQVQKKKGNSPIRRWQLHWWMLQRNLRQALSEKRQRTQLRSPFGGGKRCSEIATSGSTPTSYTSRETTFLVSQKRKRKRKKWICIISYTPR